MASQFAQLLAVAALAGGMFVVAGGAPPRAPQTAAVHKPAQSAPVTRVAKPVRTAEHRKLHRTAPKIAKRQWEPLPKIKPIPPIMKEEKRAKNKQQRGATARMPSCAHVKREYDRMTAAQRWAAYMAATSEQVAHGRRCLGL